MIGCWGMNTGLKGGRVSDWLLANDMESLGIVQQPPAFPCPLGLQCILDVAHEQKQRGNQAQSWVRGCCRLEEWEYLHPVDLTSLAWRHGFLLPFSWWCSDTTAGLWTGTFGQDDVLQETLAQRVSLEIHAPASIIQGWQFDGKKERASEGVMAALHTRSPASHNQMLGQRIQHPPSTKYDDVDYETPTAKRLKRLDSTDSSLSRKDESEAEEENERAPTPLENSRRPSREVPDSEAESEDDGDLRGETVKTDLESALPPVKTDKEAIAEYEATRVAEAGSLDLQGRLGQRKWIQGKSSIYVDAFNLALETVLEDESHLFDEAEMAVFKHWRELSYEGQYL